MLLSQNVNFVLLIVSAFLTWHQNEMRSLAIADLIWYSAGE